MKEGNDAEPSGSQEPKEKVERNRRKSLSLRKGKKPRKTVTVENLKKMKESDFLDTAERFIVEEQDVKKAEASFTSLRLNDVRFFNCMDCDKQFFESFLQRNFEYEVCDSCHDPDDKHALITKADARSDFLLKDGDIEMCEPPLKFISGKNNHNPAWGDSKLYLLPQIEKRAIEVWGSMEELKEAHKARDEKDNQKAKKHEKKIKDSEEMEHDFGESDNSSSGASGSSDASDTDDSSEMDEEECERRRNVCIDTLTELERQFSTLREQLYKERINQIDTKLEEVHEGVAKEYTEPLEELQDNMRVRIEVAGILKKMRMENMENCFRAEEQAARQNFENEKSLLFDQLKEDLEEKIRRLEEDRNSMDLQNDLYSSDKTRSGRNGRGACKRGNKSSDSGRKKPVTVTGPYIVYQLSDAEILEDLTIIKKALSISKRSNPDLHI